jgi:hypothetical protein
LATGCARCTGSRRRRRAYALDPNYAEIALACATSEHDFGDKAAAKAGYKRAARLEVIGIWGMTRSESLAGAAFKGLDRLKGSLARPAYAATDAEPLKSGEAIVRAKCTCRRRRIQ